MFHIHRYHLGPSYDNNSTLRRLEWKKDKTCRCGKTKTYIYIWGDSQPDIAGY